MSHEVQVLAFCSLDTKLISFVELPLLFVWMTFAATVSGSFLSFRSQVKWHLVSKALPHWSSKSPHDSLSHGQDFHLHYSITV